MFLFLRLVLGHLIADYPLQTNRVYALKICSLRGQLLHASIHALVYAAILFPFWGNPLCWLFLVCVGGAHLAIDILKVKLIDRTRLHPLFTYTLDQALHILSISGVFLFPFARETPPQPESALLGWFWNDAAVVFLVGFFVATYFATYFLECWRSTLPVEAHRDGYTLTAARKYLGIWERGAIFCLAAFPVSVWFSPLVLLLRIPYHSWLRRNGEDTVWLKNPRDLIVGTAIAVMSGVLFQLFG